MGPIDKHLDSLTRRERQVAILAGQGLSNRSICAELGITERTVEGHVGRGLRKLGLRSRAQVAARILGHDPGLT